MEHPHLSSECTIETDDAELSCDNVPRFRSPRLLDDGKTVEVTCMMTEHTIGLAELPDDTLETLTRRLFENGKECREDEQNAFLEELQGRDVKIPDDPGEMSWFAVELSEEETRALEDGLYPEAYQMSQTTDGVTQDDMWDLPDDSSPRAMKISGWALRNIPEDISARAVPLPESPYDESFFA